ncbi:hypothetical protein D9M70_641480 [compost metagenome]
MDSAMEMTDLNSEIPPTFVTLGCTISTAFTWKALANWNAVVQFSPAAIGIEPRRLDSAWKSSGG